MLQTTRYRCVGGPYDDESVAIQTGLSECCLPTPLTKTGRYMPGCEMSRTATVRYVVGERNWFAVLIFSEYPG